MNENGLMYVWQVLVALVCFIIWLIRLEGKVQTNTREIQELREYQKGEIMEMKDAVKDLTATTGKLRTIVAKLEGIIARDRSLTGNDGNI